MAVADHDRAGRRERGQRGEGGLGSRLLRDAEPDVGERDRGDDAVVDPLLHGETGGGGGGEQDHQKVGDVAASRKRGGGAEGVQ